MECQGQPFVIPPSDLPSGDLRVVDLGIDARPFLKCLCWSPDPRAKNFYALEENGRLHQFAREGSRETKSVDLGQRCRWLSSSAEGLLVVVESDQEVWVVDPESLEVRRKISVPSPDRVASSPALSVAFVPGSGDLLSVVDLKRGEVVEQTDPRSFGRPVGFAMLVVTPDGRYLLSMGGTEQLHRFRIQGHTLALEESSQRIAQNGRRIEVSPDSAYVALPSGGGNYRNLQGHPDTGPYSTYIYKVTDLSTPIATVTGGPYPRALGIDIASGFVYGQNTKQQLILFRPTGIKLKEYRLGNGETKQLLVHPGGGKLLVLTDQRLYSVEVPGARKTAVPAQPPRRQGTPARSAPGPRSLAR